MQMKAQHFQLIQEITGLMHQLMKVAQNFDCTLPKRPRVAGSGATMIEVDGTARMVRGSFDHGGAMPPAGARNPRERIPGSARPRSRSATRPRRRYMVRPGWMNVHAWGRYLQNHYSADLDDRSHSDKGNP